MQNLPSLPLPRGQWTRVDTARALQAGHRYVVQPSASRSTPTLWLYFGDTPHDADSQAITHTRFAWDGAPVWLKAATDAQVAIIDRGASPSGGGGGVTGVARTASFLRQNHQAGDIPAGCTQISCFNAGNSDATVNGTPLPPGITVTFDATQAGDSLDRVSYDATNTTLLISTVR